MSPEAQGRFCKVCVKTVVDIRDKSPEEIHDLYQAQKGQLCVRAKTSQLVYPEKKTAQEQTSPKPDSIVKTIPFFRYPKSRSTKPRYSQQFKHFAAAFFTAFAFLFAGEANAQRLELMGEPMAYEHRNVKGSIQGIIKDQNGKALQLEIKLLDQDKETLRSTRPDTNGYYAFTDLPYARYYVSVSNSPYEHSPEWIDLRHFHGFKAHKNITLKLEHDTSQISDQEEIEGLMEKITEIQEPERERREDIMVTRKDPLLEQVKAPPIKPGKGETNVANTHSEQPAVTEMQIGQMIVVSKEKACAPTTNQTLDLEDLEALEKIKPERNMRNAKAISRDAALMEGLNRLSQTRREEELPPMGSIIEYLEPEEEPREKLELIEKLEPKSEIRKTEQLGPEKREVQPPREELLKPLRTIELEHPGLEGKAMEEEESRELVTGKVLQMEYKIEDIPIRKQPTKTEYEWKILEEEELEPLPEPETITVTETTGIMVISEAIFAQTDSLPQTNASNSDPQAHTRQTSNNDLIAGDSEQTTSSNSEPAPQPKPESALSKNNGHFALYPNPTTGKVSLELHPPVKTTPGDHAATTETQNTSTRTEARELHLFDQKGTLLMIRQIGGRFGNHISLDLSHLPAATYIIKDLENEYTHKIIKQ